MKQKVLSIFNLIIAIVAFLFFSQIPLLALTILLVMFIISMGIWMQKRLAYLAGAVLNLAVLTLFWIVHFSTSYEQGYGTFYGIVFGIPITLVLLPLSFFFFWSYLRLAKTS